VPAGLIRPIGTLQHVVANRIKHVMRGAVAVSVVTAAVSLNPGAATADPTPNSQDSQKQLRDLTAQADQIGQQYLAAQDDYNAKQAQVAKSDADVQTYTKQLTGAQAKEEQYRGQVDQVAAAAFDGARFTQLSALLTGKSAQDFLDQSSALEMLAARNASVLDTYDGAVKQATDARTKAATAAKTAQDAAAAAQKILADLSTKKQDVDNAVADAKAAVAKLTSAARQSLAGGGDDGTFLGPANAAGAAMRAALSQRGVPYRWGGEIVGQGFDCSGLMQWAFRQAGIPLPRSAAAQYAVGKSVSESDLQAGDLVFFGNSASSIYHVAMFVGDGKVVHAPTEGETVRVVPLADATGANDFFGAKRIVG
jgi:peptidoglycan DL-endopeptidase CwlO